MQPKEKLNLGTEFIWGFKRNYLTIEKQSSGVAIVAFKYAETTDWQCPNKSRDNFDVAEAVVSF